MAKTTSPTKQTAVKAVFAAFEILSEAGGEMRGRDVVDQVGKLVPFTEWERERYEKTGYVRWESILHLYSIDCIKAGYLHKDKGVWTLTPEGEAALQLGPEKLLDSAVVKYREWKARNAREQAGVELSGVDNTQQQKALLNQFEEQAMDGILTFIKNKNPYDFQDLVAALLRTMGYFVPHIAKRGKDGGIDIIAYSDPLGTREPRIKVQVKHRPDAGISVEDIRQLIGILSKPGDVGLFVTSGHFTSEAERTARESHKHIELIDFDRLIALWQEFYPQMIDEDKNRLPLYPIFFLGVNE